MGLDRSNVNYRPCEKCSLCDYFHNMGVCDVVSGNISPDGICDQFTIKAKKSPYRDKEFYQEQLTKAKNLDKIK